MVTACSAENGGGGWDLLRGVQHRVQGQGNNTQTAKAGSNKHLINVWEDIMESQADILVDTILTAVNMEESPPT